MFFCFLLATLVTHANEEFKKNNITFNHARIHDIETVITNSVPACKSDWAIFAFGSLANNSALPESDIEFGILGDTDFLVQHAFIHKMIHTIKDRLQEIGIPFDDHDWAPWHIDGDKECGHSALLGTPAHLFKALETDSNLTLRYTLYKTIFICGNRKLYDDFVNLRESARANQHESFMGNLRYDMRRIDYIQQLYRHAWYQSKEPMRFDVKTHITFPIIKFLDYVAYAYNLPFSSSWEQINMFVEKQIISEDLGERIEEALAWGLYQRSLHKGFDCMVDTLDPDFLKELKKHLETLFELVHFVTLILR